MIRHAIAFAIILLAGLAFTKAAEAREPDQAALEADMKAKAVTCKGQMMQGVPGAKSCFRTCARHGRTLQNTPGVAAGTLEAMKAECEAHHAAVGSSTAAPAAPPAPDYAGRAAAMAGKGTYCRDALVSMGCPVDPAEPNWPKREQMCNTAAGCERGCGDAQLAARLKTNPVSRDVMMLDRCEENHGLLKAWLEG